MVMGQDFDQARLIPLYKKFLQHRFPVCLCTVRSQDQTLQALADYFQVSPDYAVSVSSDNQALMHAELVPQVMQHMMQLQPSHVIMAGESPLGLSAALSAHCQNIPVVHVPVKKASVESVDQTTRKGLHHLMSLHCVPTEAAAAQLLAMGVHRHDIRVCGNLQADIITTCMREIQTEHLPINNLVKALCIDAHNDQLSILLVVLDGETHNDVLPDNVYAMVTRMLHVRQELCVFIAASRRQKQLPCRYEHERLFMLPRLSYADQLFALSKAHVVITDAHDVHEDALCLNKPVVFLQSSSHYPETVWAGYTYVVGEDCARAQTALENILYNPPTYDLRTMFGNGDAAEKIVRFLQRMICDSASTINVCPDGFDTPRKARYSP